VISVALDVTGEHVVRDEFHGGRLYAVPINREYNALKPD
jgi:hypothetical protein